MIAGWAAINHIGCHSVSCQHTRWLLLLTGWPKWLAHKVWPNIWTNKYSYFFMKIRSIIVLVELYRLIYKLYMCLWKKNSAESGYRGSPGKKSPLSKHNFFVFIFYVVIALFITIPDQFRLWKNMLPIKSYEQNCVSVSVKTKNTGFGIFGQTFDRNDIFLPKFIHIFKIHRWFRIYKDIRA